MKGFIYGVSGVGGGLCILGALVVAFARVRSDGDFFPLVVFGLLLLGVYNVIVAADALKQIK